MNAKRILIATGYAALGIFLLKFAYFTPWELFCWIWFGSLLGWAVAGIAYDPFRISRGSLDPSTQISPFTPLVWCWKVFFLSLLMVSPLIAWVIRFWWFFPWLPWWSLAPYWIVRELVLAGSFAMLVRLVWSTLNFGRQFFILLVFLLANHLVMLFAYAGISGGPNYLGDGETQDCFLMQLWFKILVGLSVFTAMEMCSRRRRKSGMRGQHI